MHIKYSTSIMHIIIDYRIDCMHIKYNLIIDSAPFLGSGSYLIYSRYKKFGSATAVYLPTVLYCTVL